MNKSPTTPARHPAALLMQIRTLHVYVGMFIAPTVIFMAATGLMQIYNLHEAHGGYTPPPLIEKLGSVHKDQVFKVEHHGPPPGFHPPPGAAPAGPPPDDDDAGAGPQAIATGLLKIFLSAVAISLIGTSLAGVWMALRPGPRRGLSALLLLVGAIIPTVLAGLSG